MAPAPQPRTVAHRPTVSAVLGRTGRGSRAAFRLALGLTVGIVVVADGSTPPSTLTAVLGLAACYLILSTFVRPAPVGRATATSSPAERRAARGERAAARMDVLRAGADVLVLCALAVAVQGPRSVILLGLCAVVLSRSLTLSPEILAVLTAAAIGGVLVVWAIGVAGGPATITDSTLLPLAFALGWSGLISALIAVERERRAARIRELVTTLRELIGQVLHAEAGERQRVADLLHDDVLQLLLATRHDVTDAIEGDLDALQGARTGIDAATRRLRETISGLRTDGVAAHALGDGVRRLADDAARRRGFKVQVQVDAALEHAHHPLLLSLTRDLLRDTERSSAPRSMSVVLRPDGPDLLLLIGHDDRRRSLARPTPASQTVLAAVDQRARAADGSFTASRLEDGERLYTVRVPARPVGDPFSSSSPASATHDPAALPTAPVLPSGVSPSVVPSSKALHDVSSR